MMDFCVLRLGSRDEERGTGNGERTNNVFDSGLRESKNGAVLLQARGPAGMGGLSLVPCAFRLIVLTREASGAAVGSVVAPAVMAARRARSMIMRVMAVGL